MENIVGWHTTTKLKVSDSEPTKDDLVEQLLTLTNEFCLFRNSSKLDQIKNIISKIENLEERRY